MRIADITPGWYAYRSTTVTTVHITRVWAFGQVDGYTPVALFTSPTDPGEHAAARFPDPMQPDATVGIPTRVFRGGSSRPGVAVGIFRESGRKYRPVLDDEGNPVRDNDGDTVFETYTATNYWEVNAVRPQAILMPWDQYEANIAAEESAEAAARAARAAERATILNDLSDRGLDLSDYLPESDISNYRDGHRMSSEELDRINLIHAVAVAVAPNVPTR